MRCVQRYSIPGTARSLAWRGDDLYDPVAGWDKFSLDGTREDGQIIYAYPFDRAAPSPTNTYSVLYTALGTEALLLKGQEVHRELAVWSIPRREWISRAPFQESAGTLMPVGDYVVSFFNRPKLIEIATGRVVERWTDIRSGTQDTSILRRLHRVPPIALDASHLRFAVAGKAAISVVQLTDGGSSEVARCSE